MKGNTLKLVIVLGVIAVVIGLTIASTGGPGTTYSDGSVMGKIITDANGSATFSTPAVFSEGDPAHESAHVFGAFTGVSGIETVEVDTAALTVTVNYDPEVVSEEAVAKLLREAGYLR